MSIHSTQSPNLLNNLKPIVWMIEPVVHCGVIRPIIFGNVCGRPHMTRRALFTRHYEKVGPTKHETRMAALTAAKAAVAAAAAAEAEAEAAAEAAAAAAAEAEAAAATAAAEAEAAAAATAAEAEAAAAAPAVEEAGAEPPAADEST